MRRSGSRSRFLKKDKSKENFAAYQDPENISNFNSQTRVDNEKPKSEYDTVRSSYASKKVLHNKNRVIDDELIIIEES